MDKNYFTYMGSLTTPGFQENNVWTVLSKLIMDSKQAIERIRELRYGGEDSYKLTVTGGA